MNLLFITRKVDRGDPLTGFIFGWINGLSARLDNLFVICQEKGDVAGLAANVSVHSFGKEKGYGRLRQAGRLFMLSLKYGRRTDGFFVHMHPVYAICAWLPAKLFRKKMIMWYTHKSVDLKLRLAHLLVDEVLTASAESFRLPSKKAKAVGHGIDIGKFKIKNLKIKNSSPSSKFRIVSVGRISPVKDYETLIKAVEILTNKEHVADLDVNIYGTIGLPEHQPYLDSLVEFVQNAGLDGVIKFQGGLDYDYVDEVYQEADLTVNLSRTGSVDKAVLEAMAAGCLVLTSNEAFSKILPEEMRFCRDNPRVLSEKIRVFMTLSAQRRAEIGKKISAEVVRNHNLETLTKTIIEQFKV